MKIISLLQPWATLLVQGHKRVETRSWNTKYRGPIFIHASGTLNKKTEGMTPFERASSNDHFIRCVTRPYMMEFGKIIGMVNIDECLKIHRTYAPPQEYLEMLTPQELAFGNYEVDRYMWFCSGAVEFKRPMPFKGERGVRDFKGETFCHYCGSGNFPNPQGVHFISDTEERFCLNFFTPKP
jgi:hypothetical protein